MERQEPELPSCLKQPTRKSDNIYKTIVFKTLDSRKQMICRGPPSNMDQHICVRKFIQATLKPPEFCKNCQRSIRLKRIYITTARVKKLHNTQDIMLSTWRVLPQYCSNISLIQIKFKCKDIKTAIINISHTINKLKE